MIHNYTMPVPAQIHFQKYRVYPDKYNCLINTPSPITKEEPKACMEGYYGWVGRVHAYAVSDDGSKIIVTAVTWLCTVFTVCDRNSATTMVRCGTIAHCTCMARLGLERPAHIFQLCFCS